MRNVEHVSVACDRCRAAKCKCSGSVPCTRCTQKGFDCVVTRTTRFITRRTTYRPSSSSKSHDAILSSSSPPSSSASTAENGFVADGMFVKTDSIEHRAMFSFLLNVFEQRIIPVAAWGHLVNLKKLSDLGDDPSSAMCCNIIAALSSRGAGFRNMADECVQRAKWNLAMIRERDENCLIGLLMLADYMFSEDWKEALELVMDAVILQTSLNTKRSRIYCHEDEKSSCTPENLTKSVCFAYDKASRLFHHPSVWVATKSIIGAVSLMACHRPAMGMTARAARAQDITKKFGPVECCGAELDLPQSSAGAAETKVVLDELGKAIVGLITAADSAQICPETAELLKFQLTAYEAFVQWKVVRDVSVARSKSHEALDILDRAILQTRLEWIWVPALLRKVFIMLAELGRVSSDVVLMMRVSMGLSRMAAVHPCMAIAHDAVLQCVGQLPVVTPSTLKACQEQDGGRAAADVIDGFVSEEEQQQRQQQEEFAKELIIDFDNNSNINAIPCEEELFVIHDSDGADDDGTNPSHTLMQLAFD